MIRLSEFAVMSDTRMIRRDAKIIFKDGNKEEEEEL